MIYGEQAIGRTSLETNIFWNEHSQVTKIMCIIAPKEYHSGYGYMYFQLKTWYSYDRCPNRIYFNTPMLIIYLSAMETLICHYLLLDGILRIPIYLVLRNSRYCEIQT